MKLYKFRSVENLHYVIDIIFNKRLFCCKSELLNDIREADVRVGNDEGRVNEIITFGDTVTRQLRNLRVCSFCKTFNNHLLWAHYAGGYNGIAIEVDLDDSEVTNVTYDNDYIFLSDLSERLTPMQAAVSILSRKYKAWSYEEEVRIISESEFFGLSRPITRIIVGSRTTPSLVSALYLICNHFGIVLERMVVADWGIYTVGVQPMHV